MWYRCGFTIQKLCSEEPATLEAIDRLTTGKRGVSNVDNINIRPDGTGQQTAIRRRWDREKQGDIINDNIINKTEQGTSRSLAYIHRFDNS